MTTPTLTCEHCGSEIDVAKDPGCIQDGGMDVICEACREHAWDNWQQSAFYDWPVSITERVREAYRVKRGWQA